MTQALQTISLNKIDGTPATLAEHAGKVLLVVNVASKCGNLTLLGSEIGRAHV